MREAVNVVDPALDYFGSVLQSLAEQFTSENRYLCDLEIYTTDSLIPIRAHSIVLSSAVPELKSVFSADSKLSDGTPFSLLLPSAFAADVRKFLERIYYKRDDILRIPPDLLKGLPFDKDSLRSYEGDIDDEDSIPLTTEEDLLRMAALLEEERLSPVPYIVSENTGDVVSSREESVFLSPPSPPRSTFNPDNVVILGAPEVSDVEDLRSKILFSRRKEIINVNDKDRNVQTHSVNPQNKKVDRIKVEKHQENTIRNRNHGRFLSFKRETFLPKYDTSLVRNIIKSKVTLSESDDPFETTEEDTKIVSKRQRLSSNQDFDCQFCEFQTNNRSFYDLHILSYHEPFDCQRCKHRSTGINDWHFHNMRFHGENIRCPICPELMTGLKDLKSHILHIHAQESNKGQFIGHDYFVNEHSALDSLEDQKTQSREIDIKLEDDEGGLNISQDAFVVSGSIITE